MKMATREGYLLICSWVLMVCELALAGSRPMYGDKQGAQVSYNDSTDARRFPANSDQYMHFISPLNFEAIDGRIVVGAADTLLLLEQDLSYVGEFDWMSEDTYKSQCENGADNTDFACRNHIRVYRRIPSNEDLLFVCGTQAGEDPQCRTVDISGSMLGSGSTPVSASEGLISYYPEFPGFGEFRNFNSSDTTFFTAGLFDGANGVGRHFSISYQSIDFTNSTDPDTLETTENFRTINANNNWLRYPVTFVDYYKADYEPRAGSMNPDEYKFYFVFLRENILVQNNMPDVLIPDDAIYSRVARICQNDRGTDPDAQGSSFFRTYMKARIFCERRVPQVRESLGEFNYRYNILRGVAFNDEGRYNETGPWLKMMYGAFSVPRGENVSSAICAYPADASKDNDGVFGVFSNDIIRGEGGEVINDFFECDPAGRSEEDAKLEVIVTRSVSQIAPDPLAVFDGLDITQLVVDRVCVVKNQDSSKCVNQDVLFLGTSTSKVLKIVFTSKPDSDKAVPVITEEISLDDGSVIHMEIKEVDSGSDTRGTTTKYLFVNTMSGIYRLPLESCSRYESCSDCIASCDPYCVWNTTIEGRRPSCQRSTLVAVDDAEGDVPDGIHQNVHTGELDSSVTCLALCAGPADLEHGVMSSTGSSVGDVATYTCDPGFELDGSTTTECIQVDMNSVAFSPDPPVCKLRCPDSADLMNGMVAVTGTSPGATATFTCDSGFRMIGNDTATCLQVGMNSATFFPPPPMCTPIQPPDRVELAPRSGDSVTGTDLGVAVAILLLVIAVLILVIVLLAIYFTKKMRSFKQDMGDGKSIQMSEIARSGDGTAVAVGFETKAEIVSASEFEGVEQQADTHNSHRNALRQNSHEPLCDAHV